MTVGILQPFVLTIVKLVYQYDLSSIVNMANSNQSPIFLAIHVCEEGNIS